MKSTEHELSDNKRLRDNIEISHEFIFLNSYKNKVGIITSPLGKFQVKLQLPYFSR